MNTISAPVSAGFSPSMSMTDPLSMRGQKPEEVAQQFESLFISMLVKEMRQTSGGEGLFPGDNSDTYGGLFDMYMGQHIAAQGGIGMSEQIAAAVQRQMQS